MAQDLTLAASLENPPWAESSDPDEEAVIHSLRVDAIVDLDGGELAVDLVQRDDLCLTDSGVAIVRDPAWIRVAGVRVGLDQALNLARLLVSAKEIAEPPRGVGVDLPAANHPLDLMQLPSIVGKWLQKSLHEAAKVRRNG